MEKHIVKHPNVIPNEYIIRFDAHNSISCFNHVPRPTSLDLFFGLLGRWLTATALSGVYAVEILILSASAQDSVTL
jgi:hypothetical protein